MPRKYPKWFLKKLASIKAKRAKTVIDHVLKHGFITTEQLKNKYGYDHPPRAIRDVKEYGIQLEMYRVAGSHGRKSPPTDLSIPQLPLELPTRGDARFRRR